jgi:hypothetical protein
VDTNSKKDVYDPKNEGDYTGLQYFVKVKDKPNQNMYLRYDQMIWIYHFINGYEDDENDKNDENDENDKNIFTFNESPIDPVLIYNGEVKSAGSFGLVYIFTVNEIKIAMKIIVKREDVNTDFAYSEAEILHELKKMDPNNKVFIKYYGYILNNYKTTEEEDKMFVKIDNGPQDNLIVKLYEAPPNDLIINFAEGGDKSLGELWKENYTPNDTLIKTLFRLFIKYCNNLVTYNNNNNKWFVHHDIKANNLVYFSDDKIRLINCGMSFFNKKENFNFKMKNIGTDSYIYLFCYDSVTKGFYIKNSPLYDIASLALIILLSAKKTRSEKINKNSSYEDLLLQNYFTLNSNNKHYKPLSQEDFDENIFENYGKILKGLNKLIYCVRYWNSRECPNYEFPWVKNSGYLTLRLDAEEKQEKDYYVGVINQIVKNIFSSDTLFKKKNRVDEFINKSESQ